MQLESTFSPTRVPRLPFFNARWAWVAAIVALVALSLIQAGVFGGATLINSGGWTLTGQFAQAALQPKLSVEFLILTLNASLITLAFALCGTSLSLIIGVIGGVLSSEVWWQAVSPQSRRARGVWWSVRAGLSLPRAIHEVIWGLFFVNILGLNPLAAILAIAIPFGAITAKVFSEILDETSRAPLRALLNSGASPSTAFLYSLVPQSISSLLSYTFYRLECSIRSAAVLGVIGAGGLGYEIWLSFQSLRYHEMWTLIFALIILSGAVDMWSSQLRRRFGGSPRLQLVTCQTASVTKPTYKHDRLVTFSLIVLAILIPLSFWYVRADFGTLFTPRAAKLFVGVLSDSFPPTLDFILLQELARHTLHTLAMSVLAITLAAFGGLMCAFPAAQNFLALNGVLSRQHRNVMTLMILAPTRFVLLTLRAIPASVWALVLLFVFFPGILPGALALGVYTLGILGRLMAEVIESLDERPLYALKASGATGAQIFFYAVLPRAVPAFLSYVLYRLEVCARETVIIGVVGAAGLGRVLAEQLSNFDYRSVLTTLLFFIALTIFVDMIGVFARRAMR